jgi:hypothetical protein
MANAGANATNSSMATRIFIMAIGGNRADTVHAVVPQPDQPFGVVSVLSQGGNVAWFKLPRA